MAGTLVISTLSDGTNSTSSTNCISGSAKAWVNFAGATGTIAAAFNVSSVTRHNTGNYTVNFTNAFADANYSMVGASSGGSGGSTSISTTGAFAFSFTTTGANFNTIDASGNTVVDAVTVGVAFFR